MPANPKLQTWLENAVSRYQLDLVAVYRKNGGASRWPLIAQDADDLARQLEQAGHFLPLPQEPAALANVLEVSLVDFLVEAAAGDPSVTIRRGTERGYPDLEISGKRFGGGFHAIDVKIAKRNNARTQTQSRITLYTGNTYFRYPKLPWPGILRPFQEYASHLDLVGIYTLDEQLHGRVTDLNLLVTEPWRIASRQRSSTTREYIGAVMKLDDLFAGRGEFETEAEFYAYWRKFPFKIGRAAQQQLDKLLAEQED